MDADESRQTKNDEDSLPTTATEQASTPIDETEAATPKMTHDSMVTVRLSEPPTLTLDTSTATVSPKAGTTKPAAMDEDVMDAATDGSPSDAEQPQVAEAEAKDENKKIPTRLSIVTISSTEAKRSLQDELSEIDDEDRSSDTSEDTHEVNWEQLEKTEGEQTKDEETDNSTALLLARLEQENAKLATNPKSVKVQAVENATVSRPRPPSMAQLRQLVNGPAPSALRYSMLPPPPMTDLEFYAALVKDYQQTAARLPTLLSNKIRKGIPPPLRGVVWQSMSGARDGALEEQYERFCGESSPYELLIGKDLGRSFPGVDMFRDADGDGQRMLGRVLKSFSLYDTKIGYCQGLAFLVGPLLMHMPDTQAFCVLVRLMERYDLRACFLPDLSGLHVRIYQFRELLRSNLPALSNHLEELQVETAYVSQWFLSFFAVTCPLPMLFRIYDVIFAEGASETLMRVALSLMRKNESRLLACTELEDVMQLLLSRGLWDCYHYDADEFVQDFGSLTGEVTREKLSYLEQGYKESLIATANAARASDITSGASRFLGRIWASSSKSATLAPNPNASARSVSMLRRSTSKQSLASTLNSMEASSASVTSSTSTEATRMSRQSSKSEEEISSRESTPVGPKSIGSIKNTEDRYLHSQIEDLLTALSELQRSNALLTNQLQREREEREDDRRVVRQLLDGLRKKANGSETGVNASGEGDVQSTVVPSTEVEAKVQDETEQDDEIVDADTDAGIEADEPRSPKDRKLDAETQEKPNDGLKTPSTEDLSDLLDRVENRFAIDKQKHRSSMMQSKAQLRDELVQAKDHLASALSQTQGLNRRIYDQEQEMSVLKEQLRERHGHVRTLHQDNQRLEKQIHGMRARVSASATCEPLGKEAESEWSSKSNSGGLRELKLGRSRSTPSQVGTFNKRISSMPQVSAASSEHEALLAELVQAKTAEAMAKQEAEEAKQKVEALRKTYGLTPSDPPSAATASTTTPTSVPAVAGAIGMFGRLTGQTTTPVGENGNAPKAVATATGTSTVSGGFWGWRR